MGKLFGGPSGLVVPKGTQVEHKVYGVVVTVEVNEFRQVEGPQGTARLLVDSASYKTGIDAETKKEAATVAVQGALNFIESQIPASERDAAE